MATVQTSVEALETLLNRGVVDAVVRADLERMLRAGKPLRIKFGVDPSRPDLHLGHAVGFRKIRQFQELGHRVIIIIGDWTARIGDPSGRSDTRQMLSAAEVQANAQTYLDQMGKIVEVDKIEVAWQTSWFEDFCPGRRGAPLRQVHREPHARPRRLFHPLPGRSGRFGGGVSLPAAAGVRFGCHRGRR